MRAPATLATTCSLLLAIGMVTAGLGPSLPDLARNAESSLAALGSVFTALFSGALLAQLGAGPLNDRIGQRPLLLAGALLLGLGMLGVTASRALPLTLTCAAIAGLGHGTLVITAHVLVAGLFPARKAAALNLMNVFFGVGAVAGPAMAGLALARWGTALPALWVGAALLLVLLVLLPFVATVPEAAPGDDQDPGSRGRRVYRSPILWVLGALLFIYVGVENGMGGWTATYLERATGLAAARAALVTSGFWLALTGGRLAGAALGTRLAPETLLSLSLGGSVLGGALLVLSGGVVALAVAAVMLLGFSLGPVFPTTVAITTGAFPRASGTATSVVLGVGSGGGIVLPWLQGVLLDWQGPRASVLLVLACAGAMLSTYLGYRALRRRPGYR